MLPGAYDLNLYRGDTTRLQFSLWRNPEKTVSFDLTGAVAAAQIRDRPDSNVTAHLVCVVMLPNTIEVTVPAGAAAQLKSRGCWDLQLTWPSGDIQTVLAGGVYAVLDVTRSEPA